MDNYDSQFCPRDSQISCSIPMEQNNDDIQDLANFPRDSFVDHTPNSYINHSFTPFQNAHRSSNQNINTMNNNNSDQYEYGYNSHLTSNLYLYQDPLNYEGQNIRKKEQSKKHKKSLNTKKSNYNTMIRPEDEPIPQDTIIEDEPMIEKEEEPMMEKEEEYNDFVSNDFISNDFITQQTLNERINNSNINNKYKNNYKNINIDKLYEKCRKNGTPPPDGDFSLEGWKLFYPSNEKFFLWEKGKTIPNQILVNNENDEENIEIYEGEVNKNNEKHGFGILTTPKYVRKGTWRDGEFTGWCRESRINGDIFEGKYIDGAIFGKGINKSHKGNLYVGDFVDSKREGKGDLKTKKIHYEGDFKFDKFNGQGKLEFLKEGHSYEGEFKNNEISGNGKFKWNNGDVY